MDCCCPASSWLRDLQKGPRGSRHGLLVLMTLSSSGYGVCPLPTTPPLGSHRADGQSTEQAHGEQGRVLPLQQIQKPGSFGCCYTQTSLESAQHHANQNRAERFVLSSFPVLIFPCNSWCIFKRLQIGEFGWHGSSASTNQPHLQEQYCHVQLQPAVFPTRGEQE